MIEWTHDQTVQLLSAYLLQAGVIFLLANAAVWTLRHHEPAARFKVWWAALLLTALLPLLWLTPLPRFHQLTWSETTEKTSVFNQIAPAAFAVAPQSPAKQRSPVKEQAAALVATQTPPLLTLKPGLLFSVFWIIGFLWAFVALMRDLKTTLNIKKGAHTFATWHPKQLNGHKELSRLCRRVQLNRSVQVSVAPTGASPLAVGFFKPGVLLPQNLAGKLASEELTHVLLHELAHLKRRDDWLQLCERILAALFFFQPFIYFILRQINLERELDCDRYSLKDGNHAGYARCLVKVFEQSRFGMHQSMVLGAVSRQSQLKRRINYLLHTRKKGVTPMNYKHGSLAAMLMVSGLLFCLAAAPKPILSFQPQGVVDAPAAPAAPAAPRLETPASTPQPVSPPTVTLAPPPASTASPQPAALAAPAPVSAPSPAEPVQHVSEEEIEEIEKQIRVHAENLQQQLQAIFSDMNKEALEELSQKLAEAHENGEQQDWLALQGELQTHIDALVSKVHNAMEQNEQFRFMLEETAGTSPNIARMIDENMKRAMEAQRKAVRELERQSRKAAREQARALRQESRAAREARVEREFAHATARLDQEMKRIETERRRLLEEKARLKAEIAKMKVEQQAETNQR